MPVFPPASGGGTAGFIIVADEGSTIGTATVLNFTGAGGTASFAGGTATVDMTAAGGGAPTDAEYVASATNGTLSAEVVIPGLAGSPDKRAGGGDDHEFDTSLSGWTDVGTVTKDADSTRLSHLYLETPGNTGILGIRRTAPSFPATLTASLDARVIETQNNVAGIFVSTSSPGVIVYVGLVFYAANDMRIARRKYTDPTTYSSEALSSTLGALGTTHGRRVLLRILVTSTTSITTSYSFDALNWITVESAFDPSATITDYGFFVDRNTASGGAVKALFDWGRWT